MHDEMETFFKDNCQAIDDDEEIHKHRYWDMFQGKSTASFNFFFCTSAPRLCLSVSPGVACGHTGVLLTPTIHILTFSMMCRICKHG